jgi:hypothetical protein
MNKECPEKSSSASNQTCCNCKVVDGGERHPSSCRGCRRAKDGMRMRKLQIALKATTGSVFSSSRTTPGLQSFAAVLRNNTQAAATASLSCTGLPCHSERHIQQRVLNQFRLLLQTVCLWTTCSKIRKEILADCHKLNGAESEEDRIMTITNIYWNPWSKVVSGIHRR